MSSRGATIAFVMGVVSIPAALILGFFLRFTPFVFAGKYAYVGAVCGIAILLAAVGLVQAVICWRTARRSPRGTRNRGSALASGIASALFCIALIVGYVTVWMWLPTQISETPFGG